MFPLTVASYSHVPTLAAVKPWILSVFYDWEAVPRVFCRSGEGNQL